MSSKEPGIDAWKENTSAFDRVQSIASALSQPRSASYIAEEAHVAENTARNHLERLVDLNVLLKHKHEGTAMYSPDPLHTRMQTLRDLLDSHNQNELIEFKADLQEEIENWRQEYGVESHAELRKYAAETNDSTKTRNVLETISDWQLTLYHLSIVDEAIENYTMYNRDDRID